MLGNCMRHEISNFWLDNVTMHNIETKMCYYQQVIILWEDKFSDPNFKL